MNDYDAYDLEVNRLRTENAFLKEKIATLEALVTQLQERLNINSTNSSMPPSSDGLVNKPKKKKKKRGGKQKKRGGQRGHAPSHRTLLAVEEVDCIAPIAIHETCRCGGQIRARKAPAHRHQMIDYVGRGFVWTEYHLERGQCKGCGRRQVARIKGNPTLCLLGAGAQGVLGMLSGAGQTSLSQVQVTLLELSGRRLSKSTINTYLKKIADALEAPTHEMAAAVKAATVHHVDETGFKHEGQKGWLWVHCCLAYAYFEAHLSRSKETAKTLTGEHPLGIVVTDRYGAYSYLSDQKRQYCLAHLARDARKIAERGGSSKQLGEALETLIGQLFDVHRKWRDGDIPWAMVQMLCPHIRTDIEALIARGTRVRHKKTKKTCENLWRHRDALFTFMGNPDVPLTNNLAERDLRHFVCWRKRCFGSQSDTGRAYIARIMTVLANCKRQGRSLMHFLMQAISAYQCGTPPPSLLINSP